MSRQDLPPWLKEQLARFDQLQQNLQTIILQKQQVEMELSEIDRALEELKKINPGDTVYKSVGNLLVKADRDGLIKELVERKELANTRIMVLTKQESRVRESVKELQEKINEAIKGRTSPEAQ
ncbi:MAG: prefoldin subunit beta [Nitrososphaerales archaeon]